MGGRETRTWRTPEFLLVIIMLIVLTVLVAAVLLVPPLAWVQEAPNKDLAKDLLEYKKYILSIILTAFGAWVGAGAAYYFGRENLRVASQSLLAMRGLPPRERLRQTPIREVPPRPLDWLVTKDTELKPILEKLKAEQERPDRWFIPITKDDGALDTVINEDAIWRFIDKETQAGTKYEDIEKKKLADVLAYIDDLAQKSPKLLKRLKEIYVRVTPDKNAGDAHDLMNAKGVFIAIVVDEKGKPLQYIDTADIRNLLMKLD